MVKLENILRKMGKKWGDSTAIIINKEECERFNFRVGDEMIIDVLKIIKEKDKGKIEPVNYTKTRKEGYLK